ncbi:immunoglobulin domain protein CD48-like [Squirrelpox virus]|uniref:I1L n=1 Tax=Squirrelpox virus TaxID=240426 RepID=Q1HTU9_9POXV|nr:immunoglobulin domain protein CD48-like [Squirrelpox virus]ABD51437.1 I1L [Squirrelpox virus]CCD83186.1 immunoglobulin domain protein CD48-like [Squirrelpox virus]
MASLTGILLLAILAACAADPRVVVARMGYGTAVPLTVEEGDTVRLCATKRSPNEHIKAWTMYEQRFRSTPDFLQSSIEGEALEPRIPIQHVGVEATESRASRLSDPRRNLLNFIYNISDDGTPVPGSNGMLLSSLRARASIVEDGLCLEIANIKKDDSGSYYCRIRMENGDVQAASIDVKVIARAPRVSIKATVIHLDDETCRARVKCRVRDLSGEGEVFMGDWLSGRVARISAPIYTGTSFRVHGSDSDSLGAPNEMDLVSEATVAREERLPGVFDRFYCVVKTNGVLTNVSLSLRNLCEEAWNGDATEAVCKAAKPKYTDRARAKTFTRLDYQLTEGGPAAPRTPENLSYVEELLYKNTMLVIAAVLVTAAAAILMVLLAAMLRRRRQEEQEEDVEKAPQMFMPVLV